MLRYNLAPSFIGVAIVAHYVIPNLFKNTKQRLTNGLNAENESYRPNCVSFNIRSDFPIVLPTPKDWL